MKDTLFLSDLDGTLLRADQTLSPYTCGVINRLVAAGVHFSYATARSIDPAMLLTETDESPIGIDAVRDAIAAARGITRAALDSIVDANAGDIFGTPAP